MKVKLILEVVVDKDERGRKFQMDISNLVLLRKDRNNHRLWAEEALGAVRSKYGGGKIEEIVPRKRGRPAAAA